MKQEELKTLLYDEIAKCNRCGFCLAHCPVYTVKGREWATPRGKNALVRAIIEGKIGWTPEIEETLFRCTGLQALYANLFSCGGDQPGGSCRKSLFSGYEAISKNCGSGFEGR